MKKLILATVIASASANVLAMDNMQDVQFGSVVGMEICGITLDESETNLLLLDDSEQGEAHEVKLTIYNNDVNDAVSRVTVTQSNTELTNQAGTVTGQVYAGLYRVSDDMAMVEVDAGSQNKVGNLSKGFMGDQMYLTTGVQGMSSTDLGGNESLTTSTTVEIDCGN